jgi:hypothetical protein
MNLDVVSLKKMCVSLSIAEGTVDKKNIVDPGKYIVDEGALEGRKEGEEDGSAEGFGVGFLLGCTDGLRLG